MNRLGRHEVCTGRCSFSVFGNAAVLFVVAEAVLFAVAVAALHTLTEAALHRVTNAALHTAHGAALQTITGTLESTNQDGGTHRSNPKVFLFRDA